MPILERLCDTIDLCKLKYINMIKLNYISVKVAEEIKATLSGKVLPSENRVLVLSPGEEDTTIGGIIIPGNVKEGKPRKGVVILSGKLDENHLNYEELTKTGLIITYGLYAGKEVEFDPELFTDELNNKIKSGKFTVLDTNEIIMAEANN